MRNKAKASLSSLFSEHRVQSILGYVENIRKISARMSTCTKVGFQESKTYKLEYARQLGVAELSRSKDWWECKDSSQARNVIS